jgi:hypothetical protein
MKAAGAGKPATATAVRSRVKSLLRWLSVLNDGLLHGRPHQLGTGEGAAMERCLAKLDIHLMTTTQGLKADMRLLRGAKPVAFRYYGAPICRSCALYLREHWAKGDKPKRVKTIDVVPEREER